MARPAAEARAVAGRHRPRCRQRPDFEHGRIGRDHPEEVGPQFRHIRPSHGLARRFTRLRLCLDKEGGTLAHEFFEAKCLGIAVAHEPQRRLGERVVGGENDAVAGVKGLARVAAEGWCVGGRAQ